MKPLTQILSAVPYSQSPSWATKTCHYTRYAGIFSSVTAVKASVIQDSGLGPVSYDVISLAADLHPVTPVNRFYKFADDIYNVPLLT